jgi:hypothetical protein
MQHPRISKFICENNISILMDKHEYRMLNRLVSSGYENNQALILSFMNNPDSELKQRVTNYAKIQSIIDGTYPNPELAPNE